MRLESRFRVLRSIQSAEGRETILAQDRLLGVACVLKLAAAGGPAGLHLRQEGQRLGALSHPRLVRLHAHLHGIEREGDAQLLEGFATAWVDGQPLEQALQGAPLAEVWGALAQLLSVVDHLHGNGILHLDIKDDNALYGPGGLTLLDLGSAQPTDVGPGLSGGTLGYAAPEVVAGEAASVASDLYSVGVLFFRLLTGELPRETRLSGPALGGEALPLRALRPDVPVAMAELLEAMIAWEPGRRPADVRSVRSRLADLGVGDRRQVGAPPRVGADDPLHRLVQRLSPPRAGGGRGAHLERPPAHGGRGAGRPRRIAGCRPWI